MKPTTATLSVKVASFLKKELDLDEVEERFSTNSKVVLGYISNDVRWFETFVSNRVQQIKDNTTSGQLCYIPTRENPADFASRRWNATQVNSNDCWFQVPPFLWQNMKFWPGRDADAELPNGHPELNKGITSCSALLSEVVIASMGNRTSICLKLKKVIALVLV